jgi:hypothetical protein
VSGLAKFSGQSVVWLVRADDWGVDRLRTRFFRLAEEHFPQSTCHVLARDIAPTMRLMMMVANRRRAPYNVLVRIDLPAELTGSQAGALARLRDELPAAQRRVFLTVNHQFHRSGDGPDDVAMAFINTWPAHRSRAEAQEHWVRRHGPLVLTVGLPPVITSYTQVHFAVDTAYPEVFDQTYQGLSFETITSQADLVKAFAGSAALRRLNRALLKDEKNFTGPPLFSAFTTMRP